MSKKANPTKSQPLQGMRILVGRARHQAGALSAELRKLGANVVEIPFIEICKPRSFKPLDAALKNLATYDWLILTSVNGVEAMWERMGKLREGRDFSRAVKTPNSKQALASEGSSLHIAAIGPATKKAIEQRGASVDVVPKEYVAESVVRSLKTKVEGKRVLLVRAKIARDVIPHELRKAGAHVDVVEAYETVVPQSSRRRLQTALKNPKRRPHVVTFTSSSTAKNFVELLGGRNAARKSALTGISMASIGPVTSSTLRELGLNVDIAAKEFTVPGLIAALIADTNTRTFPVGAQANRRMWELLKKTKIPKKLAPKLERILDAGFVQEKGCILLASQAGPSYGGESMDRIGYECFVNHLHIASFPQAWLYAKELLERLRLSHSGKFAVIVAFDGKDATVRFHKVRSTPGWSDDDLENYREEAVARFQTN